VVKILNGISPTMFPDGCCIILRKIDVNTVKEVIKDGFTSAIGHEATAQLLSVLLGTQVPTNRTQIKLDYGEMAIVFTLKSRLPEGKILRTLEEIEQIGYEFYSIIVWNPDWDRLGQ
jgi:hypothetical protein